MHGFLCDYQNEAVILSDGRVTTCCLDPLAQNVFGRIDRDDFETIEARYRANVRAVSRDAYALPRCRICHDKLAAAGFPATGTYRINPPEAEREAFVAGKERLRRLVIEPSARCNLSCRGCMQSRKDIPSYRQGSLLDLDACARWLMPRLGDIEAIRLYNYGETFMHKGAMGFVETVKRANPALHLDIATNALLLDTPEKRRRLVASGVDVLYFSIHGGSQRSVEPYMTEAFSFDRVCSILADIAACRAALGRRTPRLVWKYLLFAWNDAPEETGAAQRLADELGLDAIIFQLPGFPPPSPRYKADGAARLALCRQFDRFPGGS